MPSSIPNELSHRFIGRSTGVTQEAVYAETKSIQASNADYKLNVAFVGLGDLGRLRLKESVGGSIRVVALCDVDKKAIQKAKAYIKRKDASIRVGEINTYNDYRKMLAREVRLDAVVVATPERWHVPIAKAALLAGKHYFGEKPLKLTIAEGRELRELAANSKRVAQIGPTSKLLLRFAMVCMNSTDTDMERSYSPFFPVISKGGDKSLLLNASDRNGAQACQSGAGVLPAFPRRKAAETAAVRLKCCLS